MPPPLVCSSASSEALSSRHRTHSPIHLCDLLPLWQQSLVGNLLLAGLFCLIKLSCFATLLTVSFDGPKVSSIIVLLAVMAQLLPAVAAIVHDGRTIPDSYSYHDQHDGREVMREYLMHEMSARVRMICPKDYFISEVTLALVLSEDYLNSVRSSTKLAQPFTHYLLWSSEEKSPSTLGNSSARPNEAEGRHYGASWDKRDKLYGDDESAEINQDENKHIMVNGTEEIAAEEEFGYVLLFEQYHANTFFKSQCPSIARCLGYVGCLFDFGNEFCLGDPLPGHRKLLNVNTTCRHTKEVVDSEVTEGSPQTRHGRTTKTTSAREGHFITPDELKRRVNNILRLHYTSAADSEVPDYTNTVIMENEVAVLEVLHVHCSREGFMGECDGASPSPHRVADDMWHVLARSPTLACRDELLQVYCSYRYNSRGQCWPPLALAVEQDPSVKDPADLRPSFALYPSDLPRSGGQTGASLTKSSLISKSLGFGRAGASPKRPAASRGKLQQRPKGQTPPFELPLILRPVRLSFLILVHKDPEAVVQQLRLLYSPLHVFVYHVDRRRPTVREALDGFIKAAYPRATNIRILSEAESVVPSWASYGVLRAELQGFRALLSYPDWEFIIKLSGADMPLRTTEDMSHLLAPYRGRNLQQIFDIRNIKKDSGGNVLAYDVWHGCGGHVYNVTRGATLPPFDEVEIHLGSQWSVPHRSLIEYMFSPGRARVLKRWLYYFSTFIVPDEMFSSTVLKNSPFKNTSLNLALHWLKQFKGENALHLCRHMEDTDFCGQGPSIIDSSDWPQLAEASHRFFLSRKFPTARPDDPVRLQVAQHQRWGYYTALLQHLAPEVMREMVALSLQYMARRGDISGDLQWDGSAGYKIRFVPRLEVSDPCCQLAHNFTYKLVQEFVAVLDFEIITNGHRLLARSRVLPQRAFLCYPDGHLRAIRATSWTDDPALRKQIGDDGRHPLLQHCTNIPLSYGPAPVSAIFVELWLHAGTLSVNDQCKKRSPPPGTTFHFPNLNLANISADPVAYEAGIEDDLGRLRCYEKQQVVWTADTVRTNPDNERVEVASSLVLKCPDPLAAGLYKLLVRQMDMNNARIYEMSVVILPSVRKADPVKPPEGERGCPNCGVTEPWGSGAPPDHWKTTNAVLFDTWVVDAAAVMEATMDDDRATRGSSRLEDEL